MKLKCVGLRWVRDDGNHQLDAVTFDVENKDQCDMVMNYLSFAYGENWKAKYQNLGYEIINECALQDPKHRNLFKLPEGYHLEIKLVKDEPNESGSKDTE